MLDPHISPAEVEYRSRVVAHLIYVTELVAAHLHRRHRHDTTAHRVLIQWVDQLVSTGKLAMTLSNIDALLTATDNVLTANEATIANGDTTIANLTAQVPSPDLVAKLAAHPSIAAAVAKLAAPIPEPASPSFVASPAGILTDAAGRTVYTYAGAAPVDPVQWPTAGTYNGQTVYYFAGDTAPGSAAGVVAGTWATIPAAV